jgi:hypothetical protein
MVGGASVGAWVGGSVPCAAVGAEVEVDAAPQEASANRAASKKTGSAPLFRISLTMLFLLLRSIAPNGQGFSGAIEAWLRIAWREKSNNHVLKPAYRLQHAPQRSQDSGGVSVCRSAQNFR